MLFAAKPRHELHFLFSPLLDPHLSAGLFKSYMKNRGLAGPRGLIQARHQSAWSCQSAVLTDYRLYRLKTRKGVYYRRNALCQKNQVCAADVAAVSGKEQL